MHDCVGYFGISKGDKNDSGEEDSPERKLKKVTDHQIAQCEKFMWSQSYEMYAIGIKKSNGKICKKECLAKCKTSSRGF